MAIAGALPRHTVFSRRISQLRTISKLISTRQNRNQTDQPLYVSNIDAEPLHRYGTGGYHSVTLGQNLKSGRYKLLHKLGWGGYSTVWGGKGSKAYVAIKIAIAEAEHTKEPRELQTMKQLASSSLPQRHTVHMLDVFDIMGPNGSHNCLVYELLGLNIPDTIDMHFPDGRLPGNLAKAIAKQCLIGLGGLHQQKIGHGDLHTRNLAFTMPRVDHLPEETFLRMLGKPEIGHVRRQDGKGLEFGMPEYIVRPASRRTQCWDSEQKIKLIDFGESFLPTTVPRTLHTPLAVRAPEVVFGDCLDYRVDLWSMGCMLFELFTGQPPFDTFLITLAILVRQMREMASDDLPGRWQQRWDKMSTGNEGNESIGPNLQEWLERSIR